MLARAEGARGRIVVLVLARGVVQAQCTGALDASLVDQLVSALERYRPTVQKVSYFVDLGALENYDATFRPAWLDWARRSADTIEALHVFARASIVKMGMQMSQLALGKELVTLHGDIAAMNAAMEAAVAAAT